MECKMDRVSPVTTIFKLLKDNRALFFDTGILSGEKDIEYRQTLAKARKFKDLDKDTLGIIQDSIRKMRKVCEDSSLEIYTIPEVIHELRIFRNQITRKFKNLDLQLIAEATSSYTQGKKEHFSNIISDQNRILNILTNHYFSSQAKDKLVLNHLERLVINVGEKIGVRKEHDEKASTNPNLNTDERLVAAALYHSAVNGKSSDILARDGHISKLLYGSIASMILGGNYRGLTPSFSKNTVRVYYCDNGNFKRKCDSSEVVRDLCK